MALSGKAGQNEVRYAQRKRSSAGWLSGVPAGNEEGQAECEGRLNICGEPFVKVLAAIREDHGRRPLRARIPLQTCVDRNKLTPGFFAFDTAARREASASGQFNKTLTGTDVFPDGLRNGRR